jgi:hypothetical protein
MTGSLIEIMVCVQKPVLFSVKIADQKLERGRAGSRNNNWKTSTDLPENFWNQPRDLPEKKLLTTNFSLRESEFPASLPREVTFPESQS